MNPTQRSVLRLHFCCAIVVATATAAGCNDKAPSATSQVTTCSPSECTDPAPGGTIACDDLSVAGATCVRNGDGSCGWAQLSCPASAVAFVKPDAPVGACVLEYNGAFVDPGTDKCCAWVGGPNTCDANVACNDRSGSNCCLIYATNATVGGGGCCLYSDGRTPSTGPGADRTSECGGLLAGP